MPVVPRLVRIRCYRNTPHLIKRSLNSISNQYGNGIPAFPYADMHLGLPYPIGGDGASGNLTNTNAIEDDDFNGPGNTGYHYQGWDPISDRQTLEIAYDIKRAHKFFQDNPWNLIGGTHYSPYAYGRRRSTVRIYTTSCLPNLITNDSSPQQ